MEGNSKRFKVRGIDTDAIGAFSEAEVLMLRLQSAIQERVPRSVLVQDEEMAGLLTLVSRHFEQYHPDAVQDVDDDDVGGRLQDMLVRSAKKVLCDKPDCESCAFMRQTFRRFDIELPWHQQDELVVSSLSDDELVKAREEAGEQVRKAIEAARKDADADGAGGEVDR